MGGNAPEHQTGKGNKIVPVPPSAVPPSSCCSFFLSGRGRGQPPRVLREQEVTIFYFWKLSECLPNVASLLSEGILRTENSHFWFLAFRRPSEGCKLVTSGSDLFWLSDGWGCHIWPPWPSESLHGEAGGVGAAHAGTHTPHPITWFKGLLGEQIFKLSNVRLTAHCKLPPSCCKKLKEVNRKH